MKIKILGSAAAEAVPALWCECELCRYAATHGGKDLRRRTCYLLDDDTLIDFGPDIYWQVRDFQIDLTRIRRLIVTHSHMDHLNPVELMWRKPGFSVVSDTIRVFGNQWVLNSIVNVLIRESEITDFSVLKLDFQRLEAGRMVRDDDLEILPIPADHAPRENPFIYVLSRGGKRLLVGNDTGFLAEESWELFKGISLDAAILDCTGAIHPRHRHGERGHMGAEGLLKFRERLIRLGAVSEDTPVICNHFSHNGLCRHDKLCEYMEPKGVQVGYDGFEWVL